MNILRLIGIVIVMVMLHPAENYCQTKKSEAEELPIQYRRGIPLQEGYQSYDEKYSGENLEEIKRSLFPLESTGVWTELNPKVPRVDYLGIHFVNKDTGWAVGNLGTIIKTTDGGKNWKTINTQTTTPILKVRSYSGQIVIASGYDGLILRSTDGGESFAQVTSGVGANYDLWGLEIVNDTLGWACGATALLKTTDGGENWQRINTPGYSGNLWWIEFMDENYGFIAADGKVLRTTDGGGNWNIIQAGDNAALYSIDVIDSMHISAAGYGGTNYPAKNIYSSDGGNTWINGGMLTTSDVNDIKYVNRDSGYVALNTLGGFKTTNRGEQWTGFGIGGNWEMQFLKEKNIGYNVGAGLNVYKTENGFENWQRLIINDNFSDVYFVSEREGYAIGSLLYKTTNYGIDWKRVESIGGGATIYFFDSLNGLLGDNEIYKTTTGGSGWHQTNSQGLGAKKFFFINEQVGWAVSGRNIIKTTDGGENWFVQITSPSGSLTSIHFRDSLNGWVSKLGGRPYKTTDGGMNWIEQTNLNIWESRDVLFKDHMNGFVLESNKLYKTTDGGNSFNLIPEITGYSVAAKFSNHTDSTIFITGYKTFRSIDGGLTWFDYSELTSTRINGLSLLGIGSGYAVGELGVVLRYYDETVPVEIINFNIAIEENRISLNWITATETDNRGFFVERNEEEESHWKNLTFINGAGTSTSIKFYNYVDELNQFGKYKYRLKQLDYSGEYLYSNEIEIEYRNKFDFFLSQNYPNPFNPTTSINFIIPERTFIKIELYDVTGREIKKLLNQEREAGNYTIQLSSEGLSSGVYFYRMITGSGHTAINKLTVIK